MAHGKEDSKKLVEEEEDVTRCVNRFPIRPISQAQVLKIPAVNYGSSRTIFESTFLSCIAGLLRKPITSPPPENWQIQQEDAF